ncbi:MAG TPA: GerMN domain-containing protein [Acidimicrobiales bacterium]|nr:GerMN domain-containing protein [Acidimicrobiales bacterium]
MRAGLAACGAVVAAVLLAGCGIPTQTAAQVVDRRDVPFGLADPAPTTTSLPVPSVDVTVFFEGAERLVAVSRAVPRPASPEEVLDALGRGPTTAESTGGWRSPISTATPLAVVGQRDGTITVRVPRAFTQLGGQDQIVAAAQLVFSLTAFAAVDRVVIQIGRHPASIPTANGALTSAPLTVHDYRSLAPE